jgi:hypothetical protein
MAFGDPVHKQFPHFDCVLMNVLHKVASLRAR